GHRRPDGQHALHPNGDPGRRPRPGAVPVRVGRPGAARRPAHPRTPGARAPRRTRMRTRPVVKRFLVLIALFIAAPAPAADAPSALELVQTIVLKGKVGKLDHLAMDRKRDRLFLANTVNGTLDVVDLKAGKLLRQVPGQTGVQGVAYAADLDRVFVGLGSGGLCNVFDGADYRPLKTIKFADDADNVRYDPAGQQAFVAHAEKAL